MNLTHLIMFGFFNGADSAAIIPPVAGPFCFHEGTAYQAGGREGVQYQPGGREGTEACQGN
jgi:hypothetical protein